MEMLQSKMEEFLSERQELMEKIERKRSMVEIKRKQQGGWNRTDKVYEDYQSEISRWNNEIWRMEERMSELDTETDKYEYMIEAVRRDEVMGGFDWDVAERIVQMREGRKQEKGGRESAKQAGEAIIGLMEARRQARTKERRLR